MEPVPFYYDLGENTYTLKQRLIIIGVVSVFVLLALTAAILAIAQNRPFFFDFFNPATFSIIGIKIILEQRKDRLYPEGKFYVRINDSQELEYQNIGKKAPVRISLQHIKQIQRNGAQIGVNVEGKPWQYIDITDRKRAMIILQHLQQVLVQHKESRDSDGVN